MNDIQRFVSPQHPVDGVLTSRRAAPTEHDQLVRNTQKWVAQTFYGTMLKEMRKSPFHSDEFEGGRGGQAFEEMFDQRLADHMSQSSGSQLVNSIVNRIEAKRNPRSPRQILDATTAYARARRHDKLQGPGAKPPSKSALPNIHRRPERILPEITNVAPTP